MNNFFSGTETVDSSIIDQFFDPTKPADVIETTSRVLEDNDPGKILDVVIDNKDQKPAETPVSETQVDVTLDTVIQEQAAETETEVEQPVVEQSGGRPKTDKDALIEYLYSKVEANEFGVPDDYETSVPLKDYLEKKPLKDLYAILDGNMTTKEEEIRKNAPVEFYNNLPDELRDAYEYAVRGGRDWKGFFAAKGRVEEIKQLDVTNEEHWAPICKTYLEETTQMSPSQIDEQVADWTASGKLGKKAEELKTPLDEIQQKRIDHQLQIAEQQRQREQEIQEFYINGVAQALSDNQLANVKLDKNLVNTLYSGLTGTAPGPWSGRPMNLLGAIIEQHQFVEPDYKKIALMTWMGMDTEGCIKAIQQMGANKEVEKTVKLIKLNEGIRNQGIAPQPETKQVKRIHTPNNSRVLERKSA